MKKKEKISWIVIVIALAVADLMSLHNIYAADALLTVEYSVLLASLVVFVILAIRMNKKK